MRHYSQDCVVQPVVTCLKFVPGSSNVIAWVLYNMADFHVIKDYLGCEVTVATLGAALLGV